MTMSRPTRHTLHAHQSHHGWNNEFPPRLTIAPGETVEFEIRDASAAPGLHSIVPPRRVGGNMDIRDVAAGSVLHLPIEVAGALFSVGDTHAAQGDGEVCGTAIESPMTIALKFDLVKGANLAMPRFTTPGPVTRHLDGKGYEVTTGIGPDLMTGAREAVSGMIELLSRRHGIAPVDA